jgi:hypothetical protein
MQSQEEPDPGYTAGQARNSFGELVRIRPLQSQSVANKSNSARREEWRGAYVPAEGCLHKSHSAAISAHRLSA